jgi:predicted Zn-dependent protease
MRAPFARAERPDPPVHRLRLFIVFIIAFALAAPPTLPAAYAQTPDLPSLGDANDEDLPPAVERRLGEQIMGEVRRDPSYLPDPDAAEYINRLGYQLVAVSPSRSLDFVFFVLRDPMMNAFALPGGFIGVHSGLVLAAQNESELAGVMAHEIGHVTQRHIARMIAKQKDSALISIGALLLAILASRSGASGSGDLTQAAILGGQAAAIQQQLNFSRDAEREADRVGFQILIDAGFDPRGLEGFFARLQSGTRIYEGTAPVYLRTHPLTIERIADMQNRTRDLRVRQRADSLDFQLVRARLRVLQETANQGWRDALEYFQGQLQNRTTTSETAAYYGAAVAALRLNLNDLAVENALAARRRTMAPSAMLDKIVSEARFAAARTAGERSEALALAREAAARFPLSTVAVANYVELLNRAGEHNQAIAYLREQVAITRNQASYFALLGRSYAALGKQSLHHQSVAEMYSLLGARVAALQQFELARLANDADYYTMSEIDARIRELQAQIKREREALRESASNQTSEPKQQPR